MNRFAIPIWEAPPRKKEKLTKDLRKHCELIRELDPDTPITVGHELSSHMDSTSDLVDVLSFHDYMPTRSRMEPLIRLPFSYRKQKAASRS